jgi:hypothetical protein
VPAIPELVNAGGAHQEAPELTTHHVDGGLKLPGGSAGLAARLVLGGLVSLKQSKI